jgi:hypothetical protein
MLVNMLNIIEDGLEYLDWYDNIKNSLHLARRTPLALNPGISENGHLESDHEEWISGTDG